MKNPVIGGWAWVGPLEGVEEVRGDCKRRVRRVRGVSQRPGGIIRDRSVKVMRGLPLGEDFALVAGDVAGSGALGGGVCDGVGGGVIEGGEDHVVAGAAC